MDWIQGNKFMSMADFTFSPDEKHIDDYYNLPNTLFLIDIMALKKDINMVFTTPFYAKALFETLSGFNKRFVVITHNGDNEVNDRGIGYMDGRGNYVKTDVLDIPDNVMKWYATNVNTTNPLIEAIPSGLENDRWHVEMRKKEKMLEMLQTPKDIRNLVYMDHSTTWNTGERIQLYDMLEFKPWVTALKLGANFDRFLSNVYNHKFVVCPRGNGIATHREWEVLYMGGIPIQKRDLNNRFYSDLPICFVDNWSDITEDFLNSEYERISGGKWKREILTFEYWKNKIINEVNKT